MKPVIMGFTYGILFCYPVAALYLAYNGKKDLASFITICWGLVGFAYSTRKQ